MALINDAKLEMSTDDGATWVHLPACTSFPDFGFDPEAVDTTTTDDGIMTSELGIGDPGVLVFSFRYRKGNKEAYNLARKVEMSGVAPRLRSTFKVGAAVADVLTITFETSGISTKILGGGVNEVLNFELSAGVKSNFEIEEPA